jgi:hypothetical protein
MSKKVAVKANNVAVSDELISNNSKTPLVFISHDTRDAEIAEAFSILLSSVSAGVLKSFRSSDNKGRQGMEFGVEWFPEIMKKLDEASDIVCLLTHHSVDRPWILYEVGVAKGKLNSTVLGVALGIPLQTAMSGPFAQFQNCEDDEEALTKLVMQLVRRIPNSEPVEAVVKSQVKTFKTTLAEILKKQPGKKKQDAPEEKDDASVVKLFEEVKLMFQDLPSRIDRRLDSDMSRKRKFRIHPMMFEEMAHIGGKGRDQSFAFLIMLSFLKEDYSWLYEIGLESYRSIKTAKTGAEKKKIYHDFKRVLEHAMEHPAIREMFGKSDEHYMHSKEFLHRMHHLIERLSMHEGKD